MKLRTRLWLYLVALHLAGVAALVYLRKPLGWWFFAGELVLILSFLLGARLIARALEPLDFVRAFSDVVESAEYSSRYSRVGQLDMDELIRAFNLMLARLQAERLRLGEQRGFLERFLRVTPIGLLILDFDGRIRVANPAGERFLAAAGETEALAGATLDQLKGPLARRLTALALDQSILVTDARGRRLRCSRAQFFDRGFPRSYYTIEELTEELQRSERAAYEKLIRMVSHEVNNTVAGTNSLLQSFAGYADRLEASEREEFREALEAVVTRNTHLNQFTGSLAGLVRLPEPERRPEDLAELVQAVRILFQAELERRRIRLEVESPKDLPAIRLDRNQMEQVLINVIKNAVEAIGEDGTIGIRLGRERGAVVLTIADDGVGLTQDSRDNLFSPFYTSKEKGQGLGLTLVKEILSQHGFDYSLRSQEGRTEFRIRMTVR